MKKTLLCAVILLLSASLFGCTNEKDKVPLKEEVQQQEELQQSGESNEAAVARLVEELGSKLQKVSLQAPQDLVSQSMQDNYGDFISSSLLSKWISDPQNAPGRLTSSPWPDHIEILSIKKLSEDEYEVKGEIIEITSSEKVSGGVAAKRPITLIVQKINNQWLIDDAALGAYEES